MARLVIEVVDAGLTAWQEGELLAGPSPGVALLDPAGLVLGSETTKVLTHSKVPVLVVR
jgi:hypothetical protein